MASVGQLALAPVQVSAASQRSTAGRQTVVDGWKASAGQAALAPVQVSAASHGPAAARHPVPLAWKPSAGQVSLAPVHVSAASHGPADARHTVLLGRNWQVAEQQTPPSAGSQSSPASTRPLPHVGAL